MKKILIMLIALFCMIATCACGETNTRRLVLGNSTIDSMIQNAAGENVEAGKPAEAQETPNAQETERTKEQEVAQEPENAPENGGDTGAQADSSQSEAQSNDGDPDESDPSKEETPQEGPSTDGDASTDANNGTDSLSSDGGEQSKEEDESKPEKPVYNSIDVDISKMRGSIAYAQVYDLYSTPSKYVGKVIKVKGPVSVYYDSASKEYYPAVIIRDATACCATGIEFVLFGEPKYPSGYPAAGAEVTAIGVFEIYYEGGNRYCHLINAIIE